MSCSSHLKFWKYSSFLSNISGILETKIPTFCYSALSEKCNFRVAWASWLIMNTQVGTEKKDYKWMDGQTKWLCHFLNDLLWLEIWSEKKTINPLPWPHSSYPAIVYFSISKMLRYWKSGPSIIMYLWTLKYAEHANLEYQSKNLR